MNEFQEPLTARAKAVLSEILTMLQRLCETGQPGTIDLRDPPLEALDRHSLRVALGQGEVETTLDALGPSFIFETGVAGVWWVTNFNEDREIIGEYVEIACCPRVICTQADSLDGGMIRLQSLLEPRPASPAPLS